MSRHELYARRYPLPPLKNVVILPRNVVTLLVGRSRSIGAIEEAWARDRRIVVTAHRTPDIEEPRPEDLFAIGTVAEVLSAERQQGGNIQVVLEGVTRVRLTSFELGRPFFGVQIEELPEPRPATPEARALVAHVRNLAEQHGELKGKLTAEVLEMIRATEEVGQLADLLATQLIGEL